MSHWNPKANEIFLEAVEKASIRERQAFLTDACSGDRRLRKEVESLLQADSQAPRFLDCADSILLTDFHEGTLVGHRIGPYRLREQIGEGGMGIVYVAEQSEPVRRDVALKIIKPGMATKSVVARFEAERQALAMMDHPNVATVYDGGATHDGLPYFAMEWVAGVPITDYCDHQRLRIRERLQLFRQVCEAVEHAHRKGIIHRDLKPSNVLVPEIDGRAVPKVIDFGIAKALGEKLSDATVYTHFSQLVGTPAYMSPEQAAMGVIDVDTRSDVYSLGVLLYELLTGSTPLDRKTLEQVGYDEMRRIVREEQPRRPSTRVSTLNAEACTTVARKRGGDIHQLSVTLRGELDCVVMKALEKDREQRYESAKALADDIERYLNNDVVTARPPSSYYRIRKFARRNRALVASVTAVVIALLGGFTVATIGWITAQDRLAHIQAFTLFTRQIFATSDGLEGQAAETTRRELVEQTAERLDDGWLNELPAVEMEFRLLLGRLFMGYHEHDRSREYLERALHLARECGAPDETVLEILSAIAASASSTVEWPDDPTITAKYATQAIELAEQLGDQARKAQALSNLADAVNKDSKTFDEAEAYLRQALAIREDLAGGKDTDLVLQSNLDLSAHLATCQQTQREEAVHRMQNAVKMCERMHGREHHRMAETLATLGYCYRRRGREGDLDLAVANYRQAWETFKDLNLENELRALVHAESYADLLCTTGDHLAANRLLDQIELRDQAIEWQCFFELVRGWGHWLREDYKAAENVLSNAMKLGDQHSSMAAVAARYIRARCLSMFDKTETKLAYDELADICETLHDTPNFRDRGLYHYAWALLHGTRPRAKEALDLIEEGLEITRRWPQFGQEPDLLHARAVALHQLGKRDEAIQCLQQALNKIQYPAYLPELWHLPKSRRMLEMTLVDYHLEKENGLEAAKQVYLDGIRARQDRWGDPEHLQVTLAELRYGSFLLDQDDLDEGEGISFASIHKSAAQPTGGARNRGKSGAALR